MVVSFLSWLADPDHRFNGVEIRDRQRAVTASLPDKHSLSFDVLLGLAVSQYYRTVIITYTIIVPL